VLCEQLLHLVGAIINRAGWDVYLARMGKIRSAYEFLLEIVKTRGYLAEVGVDGGLHLNVS
jgi:hypothetical protein